ncbi:hypothetical protein JM79_3214 [Gramella sp. Hel_I_59]|uniref:hypothetical protein n=1 Tax=Gramella sp. Hel_I_59 TaxID=1249978 RepID=UPI00116AB447|nr:hypothetical protein [Gramella sp. Hel_I_59]TQI72257.1 hypothetical protein JM79_3214 [Gramella sp. Hel_I_59]
MIVYHHEHKDRVVLELEENELTLISFLLEKSAQKLKGKLDEPLSLKMSQDLLKFFEDE